MSIKQFYELLVKEEMSADQHYLLFCKNTGVAINKYIYNSERVKNDVATLKAKGMMNEDYSLTTKAESFLQKTDTLFRKTKPKGITTGMGDDYVEKIKEYRKLFPVGKRGTDKEVTDKFISAFYTDNQLTWDEVFSATELYLSEKGGDETYLMKAGNFIQVQRGGSVSYTLMEYVERIRDGETSIPQISMYGNIG